VDFGRHGCRGKNGVGLFLVLEGLLPGVMLQWLVLCRRLISTSEKKDDRWSSGISRKTGYKIFDRYSAKEVDDAFIFGCFL
jgi:hypothetical protein